MNLKIFAVILLSFVFGEGFGQDKFVYFDKNNKVCSQDSAYFLRGIKSIQSVYLIIDKYKNGVLKSQGMSKNNPGNFYYFEKEGSYFENYESGKLKFECNYLNGNLSGFKKEYFQNGKIYRTIEYLDEGKVELFNELNDSTSKNLVKNANGFAIFHNKDFSEVFEKGLLIDGKKDSIWVGSNIRNKNSFTEKYNKGKLIEGVSTDSLGKKYYYNQLEINPNFIEDGILGLYKFLGENIKYPRKAQKANVDGKVFVKFAIGKNGEVENIGVMKGIGFGCDEEAVRVINLMNGHWTPGYQRGIPVRVYYNMPLTFKLR